MIAVSRLLLDNIANIKAYWIMMGLPLAQVALHFGANDVQGTVVREQIFHAAGARTETEQKIPELVRFVRTPGGFPCSATRSTARCGGGTVVIAAACGSCCRSVPVAPRVGVRVVILLCFVLLFFSSPPGRLGRISYVNMAPVFYRLEAEVEEIQGVPTELNRRVLAGELDVAPISSIEYARNADRCGCCRVCA